MSFGQFIALCLGWIGELIEWIVGWCPRYEIVRCDELGIKQVSGNAAEELQPGIHWYVPNLTEIDSHPTSRCILTVGDLSLHTKCGARVQVGMVVSYHIVDVCTYAIGNYDAEDSLVELAQAALRDAVMEHTWEELLKPTEDGKRLENKLSTRLQRTLERFGIEVESCRPTDQVKIDAATRVFGIEPNVSIGTRSS